MKFTNDSFDIDNVDVEEQMEQMDVAEEELKLEEELEQQEEKEAEEAEQHAKKARQVLNIKNLNADLNISCETYRTRYTFTKDSIEYTGWVVHKMDKTHYIFSVINTNDPNDKYKLKKFDINDIKQVK